MSAVNSSPFDDSEFLRQQELAGYRGIYESLTSSPPSAHGLPAFAGKEGDSCWDDELEDFMPRHRFGGFLLHRGCARAAQTLRSGCAVV